MDSLSNDDKITILEVSKEVTVDTEGVGHMAGFSFAVDGFQHGFYLPYNHYKGNLTETQRKKVSQILQTRDWLSGHNYGMHDLKVFAREGIDLSNVFFWDTMLLEHWLDEEWYDFGLSAVSQKHGYPPKSMPAPMSTIIESDGWNAVPVAWMDEYSSNDSYISHRTVKDQIPKWLEEFNIELWEREQEFIKLVINPMKERGIKVDIEFSIKEYMRGRGIMADCVQELGFKPSSPKALEKFFDELHIPPVKHTKACKLCYPINRKISPKPVHTHTARPSFDKDAMAEYEIILEKKEDHRAQTILCYRGWLKTTSSNYKPYMELVDSDGILHPGYNLHRTKTSRLSCSDPNLQQIPKASEKDWNGKLKQAFISREHYNLWTVDFSQLQFRMTVCMAVKETGGPLELLEIFNDPDRDIFSEMAKQMGWLRDDVKTLVYLILFGGGGKRASVAFGVSLNQGKELVEEFHLLYPGIRKLSRMAAKAATRQRYVRFWTGRRRHFGALTPSYRALNAVIQGGEAEIIKSAMIELAKQVCDENCHMILQIHDEIAFEIREGMEDEYLPRIQKVMEDTAQLFCDYVGINVAFPTSVGKWGEK